MMHADIATAGRASKVTIEVPIVEVEAGGAVAPGVVVVVQVRVAVEVVSTTTSHPRTLRQPQKDDPSYLEYVLTIHIPTNTNV